MGIWELPYHGIMGSGGGVIFKTLSQDEFDRLSPDEKMTYLHRLMTDIRQKMAETRQQHEATKKRMDDSGR